MGWDDESRNDGRHPIRTLAQSYFCQPHRLVMSFCIFGVF